MKELLTSNSAFHIALTDINKGHNLETHWRGPYVLNNAILLFSKVILKACGTGFVKLIEMYGRSVACL
jgi:hypothetical protein